MSNKEVMKKMRDAAEVLFRLFTEGRLSSKEFSQQAKGYHIRIGGKKEYSKWSNQQLREIRSRNGVGRPPAVIRSRQERGYYCNMKNPV